MSMVQGHHHRRRRPSCRFHDVARWSLVWILLWGESSSNVCDALSSSLPKRTIIPSFHFNAAPNQPPLASAVSAVLQVATRTSLLVFPSFRRRRRRSSTSGSNDNEQGSDDGSGHVQDLTVRVCANSNRDVLRGTFEEISIRAHKSKSSIPRWLQLQDFELQGFHLHLGYAPLLATCGVLMTILRPFTMIRYGCSMYAYYYLFRKLQPQQASSWSSRVRTWIQTHNIIRGGGTAPSTIHYKITISNQDIEKSFVWKRVLQSILQSLMENSVLKTAAVAGDTTMTLLQNQQQQQQNQQSRRRSSSTPKRIAGTTTSSSSTTTSTNISSSSGNNNDVKSSFSSSSSSSSSSPNQPSFKLTKLLSATSFDLKEAMFVDNRLQMNCQAVLPSSSVVEDNNDSTREEQPSSSSTSTSTSTTLDFILRMKVEPTDIAIPTMTTTTGSSSPLSAPPMAAALAFASPECRFDMNATPLRNSPLGKLFVPPVVWIPVGNGIALPLWGGSSKKRNRTKRHFLRRIDIVPPKQEKGQENQVPAGCQIYGCISMNSEEREREDETNSPMGGINIRQFVQKNQFLLGSRRSDDDDTFSK